jgi:hypothetical protein
MRCSKGRKQFIIVIFMREPTILAEHLGIFRLEACFTLRGNILRFSNLLPLGFLLSPSTDGLLEECNQEFIKH